MSKAQRLREEGHCAYCGQHDMLTVDHVIPRCLFDSVTGGVPGDVPRLGACLKCNKLKSADDAFLRDVLVRDVRLTEHSIAQSIRHGAHARSIDKGKSQYPRAASRLRYVASPTDSGLVVAEPILPKERLHSIFTQLVRGLMLVYEHYELPSTTNFDVVRAVRTEVILAEARRWAVDTSNMVHTVQAGDGSVFWSVYYHSSTPGRLNESMWWLRFYEHAVYWIATDLSNLSLDKF